MLSKLLLKTAINYKHTHFVDIKNIKLILSQNDLQVEYLETVDVNKLRPINTKNKSICLLAAAIRCGKTRLIDHIFLMKRNPIIAIDGPAGAGKSTVTKRLAQELGLIYLVFIV